VFDGWSLIDLVATKYRKVTGNSRCPLNYKPSFTSAQQNTYMLRKNKHQGRRTEWGHFKYSDADTLIEEKSCFSKTRGLPTISCEKGVLIPVYHMDSAVTPDTVSCTIQAISLT